jgi:hypothetical protein
MKMARMKVAVKVDEASRELQCLQRQRAVVLKSRNMQANRLQALVAGTLGYEINMAEADRKKKFTEAAGVIKKVAAGEEADTPMRAIIEVTLVGIDAFNELKLALEKEMVKAVKALPVIEWVERAEQRGFGPLFLAILIGETGDLMGYENPAKVWRRMGCAPWTFDPDPASGKGPLTLMGATWRTGKYGKLPKEEWEAFGYSPRRRSISYLIGEGIVKQNGEGPYRRHYDTVKVIAKANHPDWSDLRCHRHAMLLATKRLMLNLWVEWHRLWGG